MEKYQIIYTSKNNHHLPFKNKIMLIQTFETNTPLGAAIVTAYIIDGKCNLLYGYVDHPSQPLDADMRSWAYGNAYGYIDEWVKENNAVIEYR